MKFDYFMIISYVIIIISIIENITVRFLRASNGPLVHLILICMIFR